MGNLHLPAESLQMLNAERFMLKSAEEAEVKRKSLKTDVVS